MNNREFPMFQKMVWNFMSSAGLLVNNISENTMVGGEGKVSCETPGCLDVETCVLMVKMQPLILGGQNYQEKRGK